MPQDPIQEIISAIRADDVAYLETLPLGPSGVYQTIDSTLGELNAKVVDTLAPAFASRDAESFPDLAVSCGKCRVGSTALTNLFGIAGHPSYYQPVKTILRFEVLGKRGAPWDVPDRSTAPLIHCKEMTGPYSLAECLFNPIDLLIRAGYPADKITMVALDREPHDSLDSWIEKWYAKVDVDRLVDHYVISALNADRIRRYCQARGVRVVNYVYEASKSPHQAVSGLLEQFGMADAFSADMVDDWGNRGSLSSKDSMVRFPVEPDPYVVVGLHASETKYKFKARETNNVTPDMRKMLKDTGIVEIYRKTRDACAEQLGLNEIA